MVQRPLPAQSSALGFEQLCTLLDSSRELLCILAPDGTIHSANASFTRVLGYRTDDLVGSNIVSLAHPDDARLLAERLRELGGQPGTTVVERYRFLAKDESVRWFASTCRTQPQGSSVEGIVAGFYDITDLQRMEVERQVISDVVHALNQTSNLDQLLLRIHESLKKILYAENCFVTLYDQESDRY